MSFISTVEGGCNNVKDAPSYVLPMMIWQKCKPGLPLAFAQTWSSLSQAFFPLPLHQSRGGTEHFQLILSFSPKETTVNLRSFISFHEKERNCLIIIKVLFSKKRGTV